MLISGRGFFFFLNFIYYIYSHKHIPDIIHSFVQTYMKYYLLPQDIPFIILKRLKQNKLIKTKL